MGQLDEMLVPSSRDPGFITEQIKQAMSVGHLISPASSCCVLRDGCEVMVSPVLIVDDTYVCTRCSHDDHAQRCQRCFCPESVPALAAIAHKRIYPISGNEGYFGLAKLSVEQIGVAMGAGFDGELSYRVDDGRDRNYCKHLAVGSWLGFDGTPLPLVKHKAIDLRDGSPICLEAFERHQRKALRDLEFEEKRSRRKPSDEEVAVALAGARESAEREIRHARLNIEENAETKAQLRAIRSAGIKLSYTLDELRKPFIVFRLVFTGATDNPENARIYAAKTADYMMGSRQSLYGRRRQQVAEQGTSSAPSDYEAVEPDDFIDVEAREMPGDKAASNGGATQARTNPPPPVQQWDPEPPKAAPKAPPKPPQAPPSEPPFIFSFGPCEGKAVSSPEVTEKHLSGYVDRYQLAIEDENKSMFAEENRAALRRILREVVRRREIREGTVVDLNSLPPNSRRAAERAIADVEKRARAVMDKKAAQKPPATKPRMF